jgi:hypothetical protein
MYLKGVFKNKVRTILSFFFSFFLSFFISALIFIVFMGVGLHQKAVQCHCLKLHSFGWEMHLPSALEAQHF